MAAKKIAKKTTPKKTAKKTVLSTPVPLAPTVTGSQAAYQQFLAAAQALAASDVIPFRANGSLAYHNIGIGLASLTAEEAAARALPSTDVDALIALPTTCLALLYAIQNVQAAGEPVVDTAPLLAQASVLRARLFAGADALVASSLLSAKAVATLRKGSGKIDTAKDLGGLATLFRENAAAIKGKTAITASDVTTAAALGTQLLTLLKPDQAKKVKPADLAKAANIRDRMWTLVVQGYDALWRACAYLYGPDDLATHVPALQAHVATTSARKKANKAKKAAASPAKPA